MQVVNKITEIIGLMASDPNKKYWRGTEISQDTNINISTAHRLLQALRKSGFIYQDNNTKKYSLGMTMLYYAEIVREMNIPGIIIRPLMQKLYDEFGETVFVTTKEGDACIVIERINSYQPLRLVKKIGERRLLYEGTCGKVILAYLPEDIKDRIIKSSPVQEYLEHNIETIRVNGYLMENVEEIDCTVISAPVITEKNYIIASISVAVPNYRVTNELIQNIVKSIKKVSSEFKNDFCA